MKRILITLAINAVIIMTTQVTVAQTALPTAKEPTKATNDLADGEVRKIDKENKKITLKHGVIKNLDMPGMTMVFQLKDASLLETIKVGDKVKFTAANVNGAITIQSIQPQP